MRVDQLEYFFSNIYRWISNADGKINIFVGVQLAILGFWLPDFISWYKIHSNNISNPELVLIYAGILLVLWSIYHTLKGIFPNLRSRGENGELVYFGAVTKHSLSSFRKIVNDSTDKQYKADLVEQIYTNSHIAKDKFESYKRSVILFFSGILILLFMYLAL